MYIESGKKYRIRNLKSGTILDLSGGDNKSIIGYQQNDGANQHWQAIRDGDKWQLVSCHNADFLGIGCASPNDDVPLQGQQHHSEWLINQMQGTQDVFQIVYPNSNFVVDLAQKGNCANGTLITLWGNWHGENQKWRFEPVC